jgi:enediyne polyketide synthase
VELIVDSTLSSDSDPYVDEHVYHGERLFPAVMGLEAMAQVAMALTGSAEPPKFENVELLRPVVVPRGGKNTIRIAALAREAGVVDLALRCEQSGFQADHFRATCRFNDAMESREQSTQNSKVAIADFKSPRVALDSTRDLYDRLLFHTGRFRRVLNYRLLRAKECAVQLEPYTGEAWFGRYLPQQRVLGCGAVRDAAIHAIQACIPHARLLPIGVRRIAIGQVPCRMEQWRSGDCLPELLLHAREVKRDGDIFEYDLQLLSEQGDVLEHWEGLRLQKVEDLSTAAPWPDGLLGPYVERRLEELMPRARVSVTVERGASSNESIRRSLDAEVTIHRRADGKPEVNDAAVSVAHSTGLTLAVSSAGAVGCDIERISPRSTEVWRGLLGAERFQLAELVAHNEDLDTAATRVWTAIECLKKAGAMSDAPLTLASSQKDGWIVLQSGAHSVASCVARVRDSEAKLVLGVLAESHQV